MCPRKKAANARDGLVARRAVDLLRVDLRAAVASHFDAQIQEHWHPVESVEIARSLENEHRKRPDPERCQVVRHDVQALAGG